MLLELQGHAIPHFKAKISLKLLARGPRRGNTFSLCQATFKNPVLLPNKGLVPFVLISTVKLSQVFYQWKKCMRLCEFCDLVMTSKYMLSKYRVRHMFPIVAKNRLLVKSLHFLFELNETWWKWLTKTGNHFHQVSISSDKNVDFLLIANFWQLY